MNPAHGWDRINNVHFYSLLGLSTHYNVKCYPAMTKEPRTPYTLNFPTPQAYILILLLVVEFISPPKVHTFIFLVGNIIPKSVKCVHSATKSCIVGATFQGFVESISCRNSRLVGIRGVGVFRDSSLGFRGTYVGFGCCGG